MDDSKVAPIDALLQRGARRLKGHPRRLFLAEVAEALCGGNGAQLGKKLAEGHVFGPSKPWNWTEDAEGKSCASIAADSTGVGMQGPNGAAAEGRMAAVAMVWNGEKEGGVRYLSGMAGGLAALGEPLRKQGGQVGMDKADRLQGGGEFTKRASAEPSRGGRDTR